MSSLKFHLALDSGAHSLFNRHLLVNQGGMGGEPISRRVHFHKGSFRPAYLRTKEFQKYLDDYAAFLKLHQDKMDFCVAVDIINLVEKGTNIAPRRSYELWEEFHKQGLKVLPVLHYGEEISWLKKYMDHCDYIGIGGMAQYSSSKSLYGNWARPVFRLLCDKHGRPKWRTHGFAMSSFKLMKQYPWTSIDSTTPFYLSRVGSLCVPRMGGEGDYLASPASVFVTERRQHASRSYTNADPLWKKWVDDHIASLDLKWEDICETTGIRDIANLTFFFRTAKAISERRDFAPIKAYVSGNPGGGWPKFLARLPDLARQEIGTRDFHYLGTFFLPDATKRLLKKGYFLGHDENFRPALRTKARPTLHRGH